MKRFCIITNRSKDSDLKVTSFIRSCLEERGCHIELVPECDDSGDPTKPAGQAAGDAECCIVLGGDGTIIQAARMLCNSEIPILGINLGTLGFLSIVELNEIEKALEQLINGSFSIESRMMADVEVIRAGGSAEHYIAINDVVISRKEFLRTIAVRADVGSSTVGTFTGDGLIVATPTGSTGYNLSAGGPVVTPGSELFVLTPICPHSLNNRSIVVSDNDAITLRLEQYKKTQPDEVIVTIDGQETAPLMTGDEVRVTRSEKRTRLVRPDGTNFFTVLRRKLGG